MSSFGYKWRDKYAAIPYKASIANGSKKICLVLWARYEYSMFKEFKVCKAPYNH